MQLTIRLVTGWIDMSVTYILLALVCYVCFFLLFIRCYLLQYSVSMNKDEPKLMIYLKLFKLF